MKWPESAREKLLRGGVVAAIAGCAIVPGVALGVYKVIAFKCTSACAQQQTTYWCGPASTHEVLHSQGTSVSQSKIAGELGTTTDGTDIRRIPGVLNTYKKVPITYVHVPRSYLTSIAHVRSAITYAVDRGSSAIPCVNPYPYVNSVGYYSPGLPTYSGTKKAGHYVAIRGYDISTSTDQVYYFDPHYLSAHYGLHNAPIPDMARSIIVKNWGSQGVVY